MSRLSYKAEELFRAKIAAGLPDECWPWMAARSGGRSGDAYGVYTLSNPKRTIYAHRLAYALAQDIDPDSMTRELVIRHKCDNPVCCNSAHLEAGTQRDNVRDMVERDRSTRGERNAIHVLLEAEVHDIRARLRAGEQHKSIAATYGVHRATISQISRGANWAWLADNDNEAGKADGLSCARS